MATGKGSQQTVKAHRKRLHQGTKHVRVSLVNRTSQCPTRSLQHMKIRFWCDSLQNMKNVPLPLHDLLVQVFSNRAVACVKKLESGDAFSRKMGKHQHHKLTIQAWAKIERQSTMPTTSREPKGTPRRDVVDCARQASSHVNSLILEGKYTDAFERLSSYRQEFPR